MNKKEIGIYIHIPFCKQKCYYCDFVSYVNQKEKEEKYIESVLIQIDSYNFANYNVNTIYIGGGTPSFIDVKLIKNIVTKLKEKINLKNVKEFTIEINPGTVDKNKLEQYRSLGINRLSIGLQSTKNKILKQIGRIHTFEDFTQTYIYAREVGFKNINVDLMIGLPNQLMLDLKESVEQIININPEHISVYSLIIEKGTKLEKLINGGLVKLPNEELERNMYWYVKNTLEKNKYNHYEISNFAKEGYESKHNLNCWNQKEYIGFGVAAHSYIEDKRFSNICNLDKYIENIRSGYIEQNIIIEEEQNLEEKQKEYMLLGLRKIDGIQISKFKQKFMKNPIMLYKKELEKLVKGELVEIDGNEIKLTKKGLDFANIVWEEFV